MTRPRCGNDPRAQLTDGDRQAVENFKAYLAERAALRDRITTAISKWHRDPEQPLYEQGADAVLAVLPPPADRAAVLLEAADAVAAHPGPIPYRPQLDEDGGFWWDTRDRDAVVALLRRMADETATTETQTHEEIDVDTLARLMCDADVHVNDGDYPGWDDLSKTPGLGQDEVRKAARYLMARLHITERTPAAGARQDVPDHVCNSVWARGEMDEPLGYLICGVCGKPRGGAQS